MYKIYGKPMCGACTQAKKLLEMKQVDFEYLTLGKDYDLEKMLEFNPQHKSLPMITKIMGGEEVYVGTLTHLQNILN